MILDSSRLVGYKAGRRSFAEDRSIYSKGPGCTGAPVVSGLPSVVIENRTWWPAVRDLPVFLICTLSIAYN